MGWGGVGCQGGSEEAEGGLVRPAAGASRRRRAGAGQVHAGRGEGTSPLPTAPQEGGQFTEAGRRGRRATNQPTQVGVPSVRGATRMPPFHPQPTLRTFSAVSLARPSCERMSSRYCTFSSVMGPEAHGSKGGVEGGEDVGVACWAGCVHAWVHMWVRVVVTRAASGGSRLARVVSEVCRVGVVCVCARACVSPARPPVLMTSCACALYACSARSPWADMTSAPLMPSTSASD